MFESPSLQERPPSLPRPLGSIWTPRAVRQVGHVRVFAAMAAVASVSILLHAMLVDALFWWAARVVTGFCYAGVLVVAES